jgi:glycosyltransferase involved in cell wall biosynthesis
MCKNFDFAITVIIPTYQPQNYIIECFDSINNQNIDKKNFEVIVILNGEKEPYFSFINNYLNLCKFNYKMFYTRTKGVSNARNIGIEQSKGEYLAFIDDDDIISENYLQGLLNIAEDGFFPLSYIKTFKDNIDDAGDYYITNVYERRINKKNTIFNIRSYFSSACYKLIKRETVGTQRFDTRFQKREDSLFMFIVSEKDNKYKFTDRTAVYYRRNRENSLTTKKIEFKNDLKNVISVIYTVIKIYIKSPSKYDFLFFLSRIFAYSRSVFYGVK